jgi:hypothetical protein
VSDPSGIPSVLVWLIGLGLVMIFLGIALMRRRDR